MFSQWLKYPKFAILGLLKLVKSIFYIKFNVLLSKVLNKLRNKIIIAVVVL